MKRGFILKLQPSLYYSHTLISDIVQPGDTVIDATAGNGHDTKYLSSIVGKNGKVYSFDIQKEAINNTKKLLSENNIIDNVELHNCGHENIHRIVKDKISCAIFNLGYLPGPTTNKTIITHSKTTLPAINDCIKLLKKDGIIILVLYYGHPGGQEEKNDVINFAEKLNQKLFTVLKYQFINQINEPPILIAIQKKKDKI
ncbi:methyltransferase domain-containing protein [Apilactobacillus sp. TMW 2.2459]|uniref:Methyltransferase domain-containing protein n=1 Tax=Apilactobacillus xinyiensis TaxID=2841032 RepID=A0ABT0I0B6_9LACO|nr:class I SAM-dependent methyltransferase [Apilactobacillus xinyiensis]MCK8624277.1 methyltransferase domain-containing protein [Apilactobacillus xinyiensis]MCL0311869.1 methyltransferase domain-containing protein [Apilactobacillus xinyiensis]MCL0318495.1 methyltransferase domain-containing protein [Apilactobacillus xinyiensis]